MQVYAKRLMYKLKLLFPSYKQHTPSNEYKETLTYTATIDLYCKHRIECYQSSASVIEFETDQDRMLALLALSGTSSYSVKCLD
jgi:hypothetical protein